MDGDFSYVVREKALADIVLHAVEGMDGTADIHCRRIQRQEATLQVQVSCKARYGKPLPPLAKAMQQQIQKALAEMTGVSRIVVAVTVEDIIMDN